MESSADVTAVSLQQAMNDTVYRLRQHPLASQTAKAKTTAQRGAANPNQLKMSLKPDDLRLRVASRGVPAHVPQDIMESTLTSSSGVLPAAPANRGSDKKKKSLNASSKFVPKKPPRGKKAQARNVPLFKIEGKNAMTRFNKRAMRITKPLKETLREHDLQIEVRGSDKPYVKFKERLTKQRTVFRIRRAGEEERQALLDMQKAAEEEAAEQQRREEEAKRKEEEEIEKKRLQEIEQAERRRRAEAKFNEDMSKPPLLEADDALWEAVSSGHDNGHTVDVALLQSGFSKREMVRYVNGQNSEGESLLQHAVRTNQAVVTRRLVDRNANIANADANGDTALHVACRFGFSGILSVLLTSPSSENLFDIKNDAGHTCLDELSGSMSSQLDSLQVMHDALPQNDVSEKIRELQTELLNLVKESDAKAPVSRKRLRTNDVLITCVKNGDSKSLQLMIDEWESPETVEASLNQYDIHGSPILFYAVWRNRLKIVNMFVTHKASLNLTNAEGETALHAACASGSMKIISSLIVHGASADKQYNGKCCYEVFRGSAKQRFTAAASLQKMLAYKNMSQKGLLQYNQFMLALAEEAGETFEARVSFRRRSLVHPTREDAARFKDFSQFASAYVRPSMLSTQVQGKSKTMKQAVQKYIRAKRDEKYFERPDEAESKEEMQT